MQAMSQVQKRVVFKKFNYHCTKVNPSSHILTCAWNVIVTKCPICIIDNVGIKIFPSHACCNYHWHAYKIELTVVAMIREHGAETSNSIVITNYMVLHEK